MSIESEVNPANKDCHNNLTSSISTPGTLTSSTNSKLGILHKQVLSNQTYDNLPPVSDINNSQINSINGVRIINYTGSGGSKHKKMFNVIINKKKYIINAKDKIDAAKKVYKKLKTKKYCLIYVIEKNNTKKYYKGICYKNGRKFVKEI